MYLYHCPEQAYPRSIQGVRESKKNLLLLKLPARNPSNVDHTGPEFVGQVTTVHSFRSLADFQFTTHEHGCDPSSSAFNCGIDLEIPFSLFGDETTKSPLSLAPVRFSRVTTPVDVEAPPLRTREHKVIQVVQ